MKSYAFYATFYTNMFESVLKMQTTKNTMSHSNVVLTTLHFTKVVKHKFKILELKEFLEHKQKQQ